MKFSKFLQKEMNLQCLWLVILLQFLKMYSPLNIWPETCKVDGRIRMWPRTWNAVVWVVYCGNINLLQQLNYFIDGELVDLSFGQSFSLLSWERHEGEWRKFWTFISLLWYLKLTESIKRGSIVWMCWLWSRQLIVVGWPTCCAVCYNCLHE